MTYDELKAKYEALKAEVEAKQATGKTERDEIQKILEGNIGQLDQMLTDISGLQDNARAKIAAIEQRLSARRAMRNDPEGH